MQTYIKSVHGHSYNYGEGAPSFYIASGGSDDWSHMNNVDIVFTVELRDKGSYGFLMPESELLAAIKELDSWATEFPQVDCTDHARQLPTNKQII